MFGHTRKRQLAIIGFMLAGLFALSACSAKGPTPETAFQTYVSHWENQDFAAMYDQLAAETKEAVTKEDFVSRYETIYEGIGAHRLAIDLNIPDDLEADDEGKVTIPFSLSMETMAGPIEFSHEGTLVEEEQDDRTVWAIVWDERYIFPQMEPGDKVRAETLPAARGELTDRNGSGLAVNGTVVSIGIVPELLSDNEEDAKEELAEALDLSVAQIDEKLDAPWVKPDLFVPIASLPEEETERIEALLEIPGVTKQDVSARVYPYGEAAAHLTGYVQEINAEELEKLREEGYREGDKIGKSGLEQVFEERLRGQNGGIIYITDDAGEKKEVLAERPPQDGENIQLTIDMVLQESLYARLKDEAGTATALHPQTGEVLALVSSPAYDPNRFILGLSDDEWEAWNDDPKKPLLNRFAQTYSPGSAFKPITAAIALETDVITPEDGRTISGKTWQADASWGDYSVTRVTELEGPVDLQRAFIYSDNIYFAQTALDIGEAALTEGAQSFGFGEELPFPYPIKASQIAGDDGIESEIQLADTGYGQGEVAMSALHLALAYTPLANEGHLLAPQLELPDGEAAAEVWQKQVMSADTADLLRNCLIQVVEHADGTGRDARIPGVTIAAKTGTAELKQSKDDQKGKENGWFVAMDADGPELLVAMMIEDVKDRGGSRYVAGKVKQVMQDFLQ